MVGIQYLALAAAAFQIVSANALGEDWPLQLLKRQEPGTNSYRCHDTCGMSDLSTTCSFTNPSKVKQSSGVEIPDIAPVLLSPQTMPTVLFVLVQIMSTSGVCMEPP